MSPRPALSPQNPTRKEDRKAECRHHQVRCFLSVQCWAIFSSLIPVRRFLRLVFLCREIPRGR